MDYKVQNLNTKDKETTFTLPFFKNLWNGILFCYIFLVSLSSLHFKCKQTKKIEPAFAYSLMQ